MHIAAASAAPLVLRATPAGFFLETSRGSGAPGAAFAPGGGAAAVPAPRILPYDAPATRDVFAPSRGRRAASGAAAEGADTLRVLVVRISFESDRLDALTSLSTGGGFDLAPGGTALIDPTPHDRGYFESHLRGLANYWRFQSCGRVEIVGDVIPAAAGGSYRLTDLADYGPGRSGSWTRSSIVRFFRDCVAAADGGLAAEGYPARFGDYDAVIVAHAGSCLQTDAGGTPNDVPACFVSLGPGEEISVDGGSSIVRDGSIVPETASQDGAVAGIAGIIAHEFGHQLGLPDLYDARAGRTTAGYFDLMDSGGWVGAYIDDGTGALRYAMGFIPGGLSAWTRSLLGWTAFDTAAAGSRALDLPALGKCPARAARIEHAGDEYFVAENRAAELDGVPTGFVREPNGVVIGTGNCLNCGAGVPDDPVWELVNGYDMLLPTEHPPSSPTSGPGVLVWRVNERLVAERVSTNTLNALRPPAVMLLEADGVADIGDPSSPYSYGWHGDAYFAGGNAALGEETRPASRSAWGVPTGALVTDVSARDTLMRCVGGVSGVSSSSAFSGGANVPANGVLWMPGSDEDVFLLHAAGFGVLLSSGDTVVSIGRTVVGPPAWIEGFAGAAEPGVVVGEQRGYVHAYRRSSWAEYDGWPAFIQATLATHPVVVRLADGCRIAAAGRRSIHILEADGEEAAGSPISIFERDITSNLVVAESEEGYGTAVFFAMSPEDTPTFASQSALLFKWTLYPAGSGEALGLAPGYPRRLPVGAADWRDGFWLAGGDLAPSEAGDEVYVLCRATGRILVYGDGGLLADRPGEGPVADPPALGDLNGDSWIDLVYSDGYSIYAMSPSLANLKGWPRRIWSLAELPWGSRFSTPATIAVSGSGRAVVAGSDGGLLYVLGGDGTLERGFPRKASSSFDRAIEIGPPDALQGAPLACFDGGVARFRRLPLDPSPAQSWRTLWGDAGRTAWARSGGGSGGGGVWTSLAADLIVYPNPSRGERVGFHFTAPAEGEARLEILTLTGELVLSRTKRMRGGQDEFVVSMSDRASGVYISRLAVVSGGRRVEAVRKFAIVR